MSFILDALRKSENERRQEAALSIARIPEAVPQRQTPRWAAATIILLALLVVASSFGWWQSRQTPEVERSSRAESATRSPLPVPSPLPAPRSAAAAAPPAPAADRPTPARMAQPSEASRSESALRTAAAASEPPQTPAAPARGTNQVVQDYLPSYRTVAAESGLPALKLELHAFHRETASRFVFINGARYREGDALPQGLRLHSITEEGAVILANGRQLLLGQD